MSLLLFVLILHPAFCVCFAHAQVFSLFNASCASSFWKHEEILPEFHRYLIPLLRSSDLYTGRYWDIDQTGNSSGFVSCAVDMSSSKNCKHCEVKMADRLSLSCVRARCSFCCSRTIICDLIVCRSCVFPLHCAWSEWGCAMFRQPVDTALELKYALFLKIRGAEKSRIREWPPFDQLFVNMCFAYVHFLDRYPCRGHTTFRYYKMSVSSEPVKKTFRKTPCRRNHCDGSAPYAPRHMIVT